MGCLGARTGEKMTGDDMRREMVDGLEAPEEGAGVEPDEEEEETLLLDEPLGGSAPAASRSCRASPALAAAADACPSCSRRRPQATGCRLRSAIHTTSRSPPVSS